jgi:hypothetical protein
MYGDDAEDKEPRVAATAMVAAGTTAWLLVDSDETKVEDDDEEAAAEALRDAELHAAEVCVKVAAEAERAASAEAAEQAAHWASDMDKGLAYRRDVDWNTAARRDAAHRAETEREAGRRADTEHRMTVCRLEAAIHTAMAAIEATDIGGNSDGGALQLGEDSGGYVAAAVPST